MSGQREPSWWIRDVVLAVAIGAMLFIGQWVIDDRRSDRETAAARDLADQAERLENLRFVRDRSGPQQQNRPFAEIDLLSQNLSGLELSGADFRNSLLSDASIIGTDLSGANFSGAQLNNARLNRSDLSGADMSCDGRGADEVCVSMMWSHLFGTDLTDANLTGARMLGVWMTQDTRLVGTDLSGVELWGAILFDVDFSRAILTGADLSGACWSDETQWPDDFDPPANSPPDSCH